MQVGTARWGPARGMVGLPLQLFWSPPGRVFDLDRPFMVQSMYWVVLGEAIRAEELTTYLNRDVLLAAGQLPDMAGPGDRRADALLRAAQCRGTRPGRDRGWTSAAGPASPRLFIVAKGPGRGQPLTPAGLRRIFRYHREIG